MAHLQSDSKEVTGLFGASEIQCGCITKLSQGIDRLARAAGGEVPRKLNWPVCFLWGRMFQLAMRLEGQLNQINYDLPSLYQAPLHTLGRENNDWLE